ncbi:MAG TPA: DUF4410 domain-containing protein [Nevskiaceae bacterium]
MCGLLGSVALVACSTRATTTANYANASTNLPRPTVVVVQDFTADPSLVRLDTGIGGRVRRAMGGTDDGAKQAEDVEDVRHGITETLSKQITDMGLPVEANPTAAVTEPYVVVRGALRAVNEGNQTRRTVVGFGAGQSEVAATAEVLYLAPGAVPVVLQTYDVSSNSGHTPGMAIGAASAAAGHVGAAAANGGMHVANGGRAGVGSEAQRLAEHLSVNIGQLFAHEHWIPQSAVPSASLR